MKRFNENAPTDFDEVNAVQLNDEKDTANIEVNEENISLEGEEFKQLENNEVKEQYINPAMKRFRTIIGAMIIVALLSTSIINPQYKKVFKDNLSSGAIENVGVGDIMSKESLKLEPKDATVEITSGFGNLEISIWNFSEKEDNDYVQVFIDGVEQGAPFSIRHKAVKISVPDKAVIQVQGVRDGSNNGITYGVQFNKTGETYLNTVPLNAMNSYTIVSK